MQRKIIIGTRGSKLALIQTEIIVKQLHEYYPDILFETKIIKTTGDKNMKPVPLDTIGKNWFTKEIDTELLSENIDFAVHSLKDISVDLPKGLQIAAIAKRVDARDVFISNNKIKFKNIKKGAVIGTDSLRRKIQLLKLRPDLRVKSIRGNVLTRLEKLKNGEYDGIILAAAGIIRLGLSDRISNYFTITQITPSPGQGALAIICKEKNNDLLAILSKVNHLPTLTAVTAERIFAKKLGGGCKTPLGAYAREKNNKLVLYGFLATAEGDNFTTNSQQGEISKPVQLGIALAETFTEYPPVIAQNQNFVVITRPENISTTLQKKIEALGLLTYFFPSISIAKSNLTKKEKKYFPELDSFDWIVFTSQNGVRLFFATLTQLHIPIDKIQNIKIAAVGKKTAEAVQKSNLPVSFIPTRYTTDALADELSPVMGKKIFMARANLATPVLTKKLQERGATVINIPIYKTSYIENDTSELAMLIKNNNIFCITFTSPSSVNGFFKSIKKSSIRKFILSIPVLSIGPVTTNTLKKCGFTSIYTADTFTFEGMIRKLEKMVLL